MATLAETIIGNVQQTTESQGKRSQQDIQAFAELGQRNEALQQKKQAIAQAKENLIFKKLEMVDKDIAVAQKLPPKFRKTYINDYLPNKHAAAGLGPDVVNPTVLKMMFEDADNTAIALAEAKMQQADGTLTADRMKQMARDPELWAEIAPQLVVAQKERLDRESRERAAAATATATGLRQEQKISATKEEAIRKEQAAPIVAANREFAKQAFKFKSGGSLGAVKNFERIEGAIKKLNEPGELSSRVVLGNLPFGLSDAALETFTPETAAVRDEIRGAIQGTLRETLGAQFTEQEGKAIFNRAYNPIFSDKENARRAGLELKFLKGQVDVMKQAVQFFDKNKTLEGFEGPIMSGEQLKASIDQGPDFSSGKTIKIGEQEVDTGMLAERLRKSQKPKLFFDSLRQKTGMSEDELRKALNLGGK